MPRPQIYHTPEEKHAANREKSKRHYDRNKDELQARRRSKYRQKQRHNPVVHATHPTNARTVEQPRHNSVSYWIGQAQQAHTAFLSYIGSSPTGFIEDIYHTLIIDSEGNDTVIDKAISSIRCFQGELHKSEKHILQLDGVGEGLRVVREKEHDIAKVISWLEEIWCYALSDVRELTELHTHAKLMYQSSDE